MRSRIRPDTFFAITLTISLAATLVVAMRPPSIAIAQTLVLETADGSANAVGSGTSLALSSTGNPHVSYRDDTTDDLMFAEKRGGAWVIETVDAPATVLQTTSLALDAAGNPRVSYYDNATGNLKYARKSGNSWILETADGSANVVGNDASLALDASGNPHISYQDATLNDLKYARKSGSVWTSEVVDASVPATGYYTSIAVDAAGNPHISYNNGLSAKLFYARKSGGAWTIEQVSGPVFSGSSSTSIVLDTSGNPHISCASSAPMTGLLYVRKSGGAWISEVVDRTVTFTGCSIALDSAGTPHMSYQGGVTGGLLYARKLGGVWTIEALDSSSSVGVFNSLALDAAGRPHVSYEEGGIADNLKYAYIPSLFISSPQPGVTWAVGSEQSIRWSFSGGLPVGNSNIYLSLDGGNAFTWIENSARDPEVKFRVPHTPTRFAVMRVVKSTPFTDVSMDSFFTIDASIALNKFEAQSVANEERGVRLAWKTTPGPEAEIRYRVERAAAEAPAGGRAGDFGGAFTPIHAGTLDGGEIVDASAGAAPRYRLIAINGLGEEYVLGETQIAASLASGRMLAVAPNPAPDGIARIRFRASADLPETSLAIYDTSGRLVKSVAHGAMPPGVHDAAWDGRDASGRPVAAGTYFMRLSWGGVSRATERVTVVR
ncbi:MAG: FlgD immunoglobulin-like domain containing protein [bacterium]